MATSAIGPGFITQTTAFTVQFGAAFAFAIAVSVVLDIVIQLNVWRTIGVSGKHVQELGDRVLPGIGVALSALIVLGGLVFNIGNVGGTGLGLNALFGIDTKIGGAISALVAVVIFLVPKGMTVMDRVVVLLGVLMIGLMTYVAIAAQPPVGEVLRQTVAPSEVNFLAITTLLGGTIGGYMTYAGAHRLVDSKVSGPRAVGSIVRGSVVGVLITGVMRALLFLAILGVVASGAVLAESNATASAFGHAAGVVGTKLFGIVLWAASITSVIGASYTSMTFISSYSQRLARWRTPMIVGFITVSTACLLLLGQTPTTLLIFAGGFNGLILPIGFTVVLWIAARRRDLLHGEPYPRWLLITGVAAWLLTLYLGWQSLAGLAALWQ